jgi:hypothetical protein
MEATAGSTQAYTPQACTPPGVRRTPLRRAPLRRAPLRRTRRQAYTRGAAGSTFSARTLRACYAVRRPPQLEPSSGFALKTNPAVPRRASTHPSPVARVGGARVTRFDLKSPRFEVHGSPVWVPVTPPRHASSGCRYGPAYLARPAVSARPTVSARPDLLSWPSPVRWLRSELRLLGCACSAALAQPAVPAASGGAVALCLTNQSEAVSYIRGRRAVPNEHETGVFQARKRYATGG